MKDNLYSSSKSDLVSNDKQASSLLLKHYTLIFNGVNISAIVIITLSFLIKSQPSIEQTLNNLIPIIFIALPFIVFMLCERLLSSKTSKRYWSWLITSFIMVGWIAPCLLLIHTYVSYESGVPLFVFTLLNYTISISCFIYLSITRIRDKYCVKINNME